MILLLLIGNVYISGSAIGLMRLQDTYKLNTSLVANGEISSKYKSKKLSGQLHIFNLVMID